MTPTPTEIADSLLPCPFPHLGKELLHGSWPAKHQFWIHCPCGAMGPHADSPEKAIAAWNRRASSPDHRAAAEEIERFIPRYFSDDTLCPVCGKDAGACAHSLVDMLAAIIAKHASFHTRTEISRALGGAGGDEWRGIETAPKDGTRILGINGRLYSVEAWEDGRWENDEGLTISPTHWRPLPAPPSAMKPQGGEE